MNKRVLVADQDAGVRESLRKVLEDASYQVALAADGSETLKQFEAGPIDLLILDIGLPIRNGWSAFDRITTQAPVLPIIITTGHANRNDLAVASGLGALMEKPLDVFHLLRAMRELLSESPEARLQRLCGDGAGAPDAASFKQRTAPRA